MSKAKIIAKILTADFPFLPLGPIAMAAGEVARSWV
jgi:hypothetical protein